MMIQKISRGFLTKEICIILFAVVICCGIAVALVLLSERKEKVRRIVEHFFFFTLFVYVLLNLYITLGSPSREINGISEINLSLFWSYRTSIHFDGLFSFVIPCKADIYWQIVLNILFYMPLGCLLTIICIIKKRKKYLWVIPFAGFLLSTLTEVLQYIYGLGLCELDDVFNNGIGCCFGALLTMGMLKMAHFIQRRWVRK